jgi:GTP-binding protein Era
VSEARHRAGVVALLGRPNAGKSSLLNALLGEAIAITSEKAQTTRGRLLGVLTRPDAQLILIDTPGVHRGQARFNLAMTEAALASARDADVRAILLDARAEWDVPEERLSELAPPLVLVRTKCDLGAVLPVPHAARFCATVHVSAHRGEGLDALIETLARRLPAGPPLYPADALTTAPLRFLAAEKIREVVLEQLREEIPYCLAVEIHAWSETHDAVRIREDLLVERESQKGIVVGRGGKRSSGSESSPGNVFRGWWESKFT